MYSYFNYYIKCFWNFVSLLNHYKTNKTPCNNFVLQVISFIKVSFYFCTPTLDSGRVFESLYSWLLTCRSHKRYMIGYSKVNSARSVPTSWSPCAGAGCAVDRPCGTPVHHLPLPAPPAFPFLDSLCPQSWVIPQDEGRPLCSLLSVVTAQRRSLRGRTRVWGNGCSVCQVVTLDDLMAISFKDEAVVTGCRLLASTVYRVGFGEVQV